MKVQQINTQPTDPGYAGVAQNDGQGAQPQVSPAKFDTSSTGDTPYRSSADVSSVPDPALTPPAQGAPGTWVEQKSPQMVTRWQRDDQGKPVLKEVNPTQNRDGSTNNIATEFKLDASGNPVLTGAHVDPRPPRDTSQDRTAGDVFLGGVKDGATHPGQFFGELADKATGDESGTNKKRGEEADKILAQLPVVGTALTITGGLAGEHNPDGSPQLPTPDVQPDVPEKTFGGRPAGGPFGGEPEAKPGAHDGAAGPSNEPQTGKPPAQESGTNAPATTGAQFDVPAQYARKPGGDLHADPGTQGVLRDDKGQAYIDMSGKTYPVRYDNDNGTWRVYNPDDPAKFQYPVRQDEHGDWQVHDDVGLKGGGNATNVPPNLQARRTELENQRQQLQHDQHELEEQIRQFPGPQHAGRSGMELAYLDNMLRGRLADVNNRLQNVNQELQQVLQQIQQFH
ncbi:hypothetical protein PQR71_26045 [Paraburkholderia fungorum]|uniref:hypothetical protein n=1 Tax=Paraburkholderia fungorum TaxID=134537 RepID=UPI0038B703EF